MRNLLIFKSAEEDENGLPCPSGQPIRDMIWNFHNQLLQHCSMPTQPETEEKTELEVKEEPPTPSVGEKLMQLVLRKKEEESTDSNKPEEKLIGL